MGQLNRFDEECEAVLAELIAAEALQATRSQLAGRSRRGVDDPVVNWDRDLRWLLAADRSLRECVAENLTHRQHDLN